MLDQEEVKNLLREAIIQRRKFIFERQNQKKEIKKYLIKEVTGVRGDQFKAKWDLKDGFDKGKHPVLNQITYKGFVSFEHVNEPLIVDIELQEKAQNNNLYNEVLGLGKKTNKITNLENEKINELEIITGYQRGFITKIEDGDGGRILIENSEKEVSFRILGVDAPERDESNINLKQLGEVGKIRLEELCNQKAVYIKSTMNEDGFGRKLVEIRIRDQEEDIDVGLILIKEGLAIPLFFDDNKITNQKEYIDQSIICKDLELGVRKYINLDLFEEIIKIKPKKEILQNGVNKSSFVGKYYSKNKISNHPTHISNKIRTVIMGLTKYEFSSIEENVIPGDIIKFELDKNNLTDGKAIKVYIHGKMVGHLPNPHGKGWPYISINDRNNLRRKINEDKEYQAQVTNKVIGKNNSTFLYIQISWKEI